MNSPRQCLALWQHGDQTDALWHYFYELVADMGHSEPRSISVTPNYTYNGPPEFYPLDPPICWHVEAEVENGWLSFDVEDGEVRMRSVRQRQHYYDT